ncbi:Rieske (2Fe-2S) protein [Variovorax sp. WS11]|uniref:aromatic ring-hydroxylating dioxygenase subunit alpha n=1 Tax=Variovorax sp. WS11 TaxID=1105204 RepID=UPI000D0D20C1|nr:aromatic ring-hydroxylating dioxygenase subunit alpha [Variovorax sp. WS11]NDZ17006.1 aromatic ring-hydroxylating dioxygenase subunit alpha [Variovorax sp. WS11]PSL81384.1 Rieske (2Fe-2S) protein [Variovorax sp. WS11]
MTPSTPFLRNAWYAALWGERLEQGKLSACTILNEPLVMYRREDGGIAVLRDICPHRFAPLHLGKLLPGDRVQCGYHGLEFASSGACAHNPHGSGRIPPTCKVAAFPAVERHTMIWVWMGDQAADPSLIPDYSFLDSGSGYDICRRDFIRVDANFRRVADNLLDLSHSPFLHDGVIGGAETIKADVTVEQEGTTVRVHRPKFNVRPTGLLDRIYRKDGERVDVWSTQKWTPPCYLLNDSGAYPPGGSREDGAGVLGAHLLTPETENTTLYHFAAARQGVLLDVEEDQQEFKDWLSAARRHAFEEQDEPMVRAVAQMMHRHPAFTGRPVLLETDAGPVRCNRILDELIRAETARQEIPAVAAHSGKTAVEAAGLPQSLAQTEIRK